MADWKETDWAVYERVALEPRKIIDGNMVAAEAGDTPDAYCLVGVSRMGGAPPETLAEFASIVEALSAMAEATAAHTTATARPAPVITVAAKARKRTIEVTVRRVVIDTYRVPVTSALPLTELSVDWRPQVNGAAPQSSVSLEPELANYAEVAV